MTDFTTMTEIGKWFGVSSHVIGRWLIACGLRTTGLTPSRAAFESGYVESAPNGRNGGYFYMWHRSKTIAALEKAGHTPPVQQPVGPFSTRQTGAFSYELLDSTGYAGLIAKGKDTAQKIEKLLNLAHQHGKFR